MTVDEIKTFLSANPEALEQLGVVPAEQIDHLKKSQAGSDRQVRELQNRLKEFDGQFTPTEEMRNAFIDMRAREKTLALRERALVLAVEKNIPLPVAMGLAVDEDGLNKINDFEEYLKSQKQSAFEAGRKEGLEMKKAMPGSGTVDNDKYSAAKISKMSIGEKSRHWIDPAFRAAFRKFKERSK